MVEETSDAALAREWAAALLGEMNAAKYYFSPASLLSAYKSDHSFSFTVRGEQIYGQAFGPSPFLDSRWEKVAVEGVHPEAILDLKPRYGFEFWGMNTSLAKAAPIEILSDMAEVNSILTEHAPDSSVRPGGDEEVFWGGIRNSRFELASLAVLVKWQSGMHVMSSVVTRSQDRGNGFATALSAGIAARAHSLGIAEIGLGVRDTNIAAQKAYAKAGFTRLGAFTNYFRE
jgi:ribosomal protein S18 acetylase RimI-like enzyme